MKTHSKVSSATRYIRMHLKTGRKPSGGFALVVTLALMVLLTILALGMLSLSTITMRTSSHGESLATARANARTAMIMALGRLQELAGPDTRVTAPADAVADGGGDSSGPVTGVWRSWEGNDHNKSTGLPIDPDYGSKLDDGDLEISSSEDGRFLGWLISGNEAENNASTPPDVEKGTGAGKVALLSEGTLGAGTDNEVHLIPTEVGDDGAYAWWIQGENQKALMKEKPVDPDDNKGWSDRLASNGRPDTEDIGITDDSELAKAVSRDSLNLAQPLDSKRAGVYFHDITAYSRGLLTNTANGGWRRDLTLMAEKWYDLSDEGIPVVSTFSPGNVFTLEPGVEKSASLKMNSTTGDGSIYPWATSDGESMSWNALADFAALYKRVKTNSTSNMPYFDTYTHVGSDAITIDPVLARIHWTLGYAAQKFKATARFAPNLAFKSTVTMWNPYNVAIENPYNASTSISDNLGPEIHAPLYETAGDLSYFPINLTIKLDNAGATREDEVNLASVMGDSFYNNTQAFNRLFILPKTTGNQTWKPGESRIYGTNEGGFVGSSANLAIKKLYPGYRITDGSTSNIVNIGWAGTSKYSATYEYNIVDDKVATRIRQFPNEGKKNESANPNMLLEMSSTRAEAESVMPLPSLIGAGTTLAEANIEPVPFLNVIFSLRMLSESNFKTKGYINTKPILQTKGLAGDTSFYQSPYEWSFVPTTTWDGPGSPESNDGAADGDDHAGYVGPSYRSTGIPRWAIAELPTQPLLSLCELQHFDAGYNNLIAPRVANAIGNSSATPDIEPEQVTRVVAEGTGYDHSYVGNHLFFDDWFVSSICQDFDPYSPSVEPYSEIEDVYAAHLTGSQPLRNSQYKPAVPLSETEASTAATTLLADADAWRNVASKLEVDGMFNINSTSIQAWTALLKHQRGAEVPQLSVDSGGEDDGWEITSVASSDSPVSRTTIAGDPDTGSAGGNAIAAHPTLTDVQIEALAEAIVDQIKLRGPFLSLSEFVNRQLSSDTDLAVAGAIEAALTSLSNMSGDENPFSDIKGNFPELSVAGSSAVFPEAAEGSSVAYGTPGWIRQADILRPLAPIMSARDDTFTIRAYGEARNESGAVSARSWCEAVVQRKADYVDSTDEATAGFNDLTSANKTFGRKFEIISFRWLSPDEV
ncbi:hypothetical protein [Luteolibacter sp. AS25]|uniref:hypothetical protein n=1 Tax=Luteolibacter sp. AS25 TaxID=3135776 RepID=UPI00398A6494